MITPVNRNTHSLFPIEVITKLQAAAKLHPFERISTIDDIISWAKQKYPQCFSEVRKPSEVPPSIESRQ